MQNPGYEALLLPRRKMRTRWSQASWWISSTTVVGRMIRRSTRSPIWGLNWPPICSHDLEYPNLQSPRTRGHSKVGPSKEVASHRRVRANPRQRIKEKERGRQLGCQRYASTVNGNLYAFVTSQASAVFLTRFVHACAHPKPDGTACGRKHTAMEHSSTPHWHDVPTVSLPTSSSPPLHDVSMTIQWKLFRQQSVHVYQIKLIPF